MSGKSERKLVMLTALMAALVCTPVFAAAKTTDATTKTASAAPSESVVAEESCRVIEIYRLDGIITVIGKDGAYKSVCQGANLNSGDTVKTGPDSHLYLKIDNDKYLMAESGTIFTLTAEGTAKDSKTQIELKIGAITSRLDEKLNKNSSYEIKTSNATMAIRGTVTRQQLSVGPNGSVALVADLYEGQMEVKQNSIKSSGAADANNVPLVINAGASEVLQLKAGGSVSLKSDTTGAVVVESGNVDYAKLSYEAVSFLKEAADSGKTFTISKEELDKLITVKLEEQIKAEQEKKNNQLSGSGSESKTQEDKTDWATDEEPVRKGTAEELPAEELPDN